MQYTITIQDYEDSRDRVLLVEAIHKSELHFLERNRYDVNFKTQISILFVAA
jgi:hypothetical protein